MGWFKKEMPTIKAAIFEQTEKGHILEIVFKGDHDYRAGNRFCDFVKETVERNNPVTVMLNFLEYRYHGGDEIGAVFLYAAFCAAGRIPGRPVAVIAKGYTSRYLKSLFVLIAGAKRFDYDFFESVEAGSDFLRKVLTQATAPSPS